MNYESLTFEDFKKEFPELYEDVYCGFHCPTEWLEIVWHLSEELSNISDSIRCAQVKEKFGSLRYYVDFPEDMDDETRNRCERYISKAEAKTL